MTRVRVARRRWIRWIRWEATCDCGWTRTAPTHPEAVAVAHAHAGRHRPPRRADLTLAA